jgi:hypothetical protein
MVAMTGPISIRVRVSTYMARPPASGSVMVAGDPEDLLSEAVVRAVREQLEPNFKGQLPCISWYDPEYPAALVAVYPSEMTLAAVREYFGDEADADPPTIKKFEGGIGGDGALLYYALDLAQTAMAITGYVSASLAVQRGLVKVRYRKFRQLATDWNDSDFVSPELRDAVETERTWLRSDFNKTFGLDASRGPLLLRTLGYRRYNYDRDGAEYWRREVDE